MQNANTPIFKFHIALNVKNETWHIRNNQTPKIYKENNENKGKIKDRKTPFTEVIEVSLSENCQLIWSQHCFDRDSINTQQTEVTEL